MNKSNRRDAAESLKQMCIPQTQTLSDEEFETAFEIDKVLQLLNGKQLQC